MDLVNNGTFTAGNGAVHCTGSTSQTIGGDSTTTFNNLTLNKTGGNVRLLRNVDVYGNVTFTGGNLVLNGLDCDLGTTGMIIGEAESSRFIGTSGEVVRTEDLNAPNAANPGNIGLLITSGENLGTTIIRRGHAPQTTGTSSGIARYFSISPNNNMNLNATLRQLYFDAELNGNGDTLLVPWRDGGSGYEVQGFSSRDTSANFVELTGISSFSSWTLAEMECAIAIVTCYFDGDDDGYGLTSSAMNFCDVCATGYVAQDGDCNDGDADINPGETEICNGIDDDCNSMTDDGLTFNDYYLDGDGDGYGAGGPVNECLSPGSNYVLLNGDCNDNDAAINPGETEICNGIDDDCANGPDDGLTFQDYYLDGDGDGYGTGAPMNACQSPGNDYVLQNGDCNDGNADISPGETETCNGIDDDCANGPDDRLTFQDYYLDSDGDGYGTGAPMNACQSPGNNYVLQNGDCNDGNADISPGGTEICNGIDDDCDTFIDTADPNFVDNTPPVPNCRSTTVQVGANGIYVLQQSDVYLGGTDNCGTVVFEGMDPTQATCAAGPTLSVTVTVNDGNGNPATCLANITVADDLYPCCPPTHIIYVNENTPDDDDGSDWDNAFADLQSAFGLASRCPIATEVWVANGTYFPTSGNDRTAAFIMQDSLTVYGGFGGGETSLSERDLTTNQVILSGDIGTPGEDGDNSYHVVFNNGNGINASAVLDGLTIKGGNANGTGDHEKGGGLFLENASPAIRNCHFMGNRADFGGGGMFCKATSATVDSCTFSGNSALVGGAVQNSTGAATGFNRCSFIANSATNSGGAFHNNTAMLCGITNCYFEGNLAGGNGGAVLNIGSSPDLVNSAFFANSAEEGAGISNRAGSMPNIVNCSFHANVAGSTGGAIRNHTGTVPLITNCIVWGNGTGIVNSVPGPVVSYSIVQQPSGVYPGIGNLNLDPLFAGSNGLSLRPCSPAIDAGLNTANGTTGDLLGNDRKVDATGTGTAYIDMGAFEFQGDLTLPTTFNGLGDGTSWTDPLNWGDGFVPGGCQHVLVPAGFDVAVPDGLEGLGRTLEVEIGATLATGATAEMDIGN